MRELLQHLIPSVDWNTPIIIPLWAMEGMLLGFVLSGIGHLAAVWAYGKMFLKK